MARAKAADFFQNMKFFVTAIPAGGGADPLQPTGAAIQAGFSTCSTPSMTAGAVEYREGHYFFTRKQQGIPAMGDMSMTRGIARGDTAFFLWMKSGLLGASEYRADLAIAHYHRLDYDGLSLTDGSIDQLKDPGSVVPSRTYLIYNALPTNVKVASDLDAGAGDVSVGQVDVAYEYFDVQIK